MKDCVFCKIVAGQIPCHKIYEDDEFLAFLDIRPANHGHVLLIPKTHAEKLTDLPDRILEKELPIAKDIAEAVLEATGMTDFNLLNTNGPDSGQEVFHHHLHIIPRREGDGMSLKIEPAVYGEGQAETTAADIRQQMKLIQSGREGGAFNERN